MRFLYVSHLTWDYKAVQAHVVTSDPVYWAFCFDEGEFRNVGEVTDAELEAADLVMLLLLPLPATFDRYLEIVRRWPAKTVVYLDGPAGVQQNPLPILDKARYLEIARTARHVVTYGADYDGHFRVLLGGRSPAYVEFPYPVDYAAGCAKRLRDRGPVVALGKGICNVNEERNAACSIHVLADLQRLDPAARGLVHPAVPNRELSDAYHVLYGCLPESVLELRMLPWQDYLRELATARIGVHLDPLRTRGQFPLECAALGVPCVCSGSVAGKHLFPWTWQRDPRNVDLACATARRLWTDPDFWTRVAAEARVRLESYRPEAKARQLLEAVGWPG